jgi:hypothetical protein
MQRSRHAEAPFQSSSSSKLGKLNVDRKVHFAYISVSLVWMGRTSSMDMGMGDILFRFMQRYQPKARAAIGLGVFIY